MNKIFGFSVVLAFMLASLSSISHALTPKQHSEIARLALEKHIRPSYASLALAAGELEKGMSAFCAKPTPAGRKNIDAQFEKTLLTWSRIDHIRFGPIAEQNRINRFIFWPDHKSIGLRQVKKALRSHNDDVLDLQKLQNKSVALQGLTALEYLLYGTGSGRLGESSKDNRFRCAYAVTIAKNLVMISAQVVDGWREDSKFVQLYLHPREDSDIYQTPKEVTLALFLSFTTELKIVQLLKLERPLGKTAKRARPKRAALWRSKQVYNVIDANMAGLRTLFDKVFSNLIADSDPGVEEGVDLDFEQVHRDLMELKMPISEAVYNDTVRAKLKNLQTVVDQIKRDAGTAIIKATDLSMGFNALDGD